MAQYPAGASREQLSVLTGYKKSSRDVYLQRLGAAGFVRFDRGTVIATDDGVAALPDDFEPLPTGPALQSYWADRLPEGEKKILRFLISFYPEAVERTRLDEPTGYKKSSRDVYLQRLKARMLITADRGAVRASDILFEQ